MTSNEPTPTEVPARHFPLSQVLTTVLILIVLGGLGWLIWHKEVLQRQSNQAILPAGEVAWKSIIGEEPIRTIAAKDQYVEKTYDIYDLGTLIGGLHAGSHVALALGHQYYSDGYEVSPEEFGYYEYYYFLSDAEGNATGWWNRPDALVGGYPHIPPELGFDSVPEISSNELPADLPSLTRSNQMDSSGQGVVVEPTLYLGSKDHYTLTGATLDGNPIVKATAELETTFAAAERYTYYVQLPFGAVMGMSLAPNFIKNTEAGTPELTWSMGTTTVSAYNFQYHAYGWVECFDNIRDMANFESSLVQTGTTAQGEAVFELTPTGHEIEYRCLYDKTQRYDYNPGTNESIGYYPVPYEQFITEHPVFFWKHPYASWIGFVRQDVVPAAEKGKPVIYLYPTEETQATVMVDPKGGFTKTIPAYNGGWNVTARPDGRITNSDGIDYPYLFWEGGGEGVTALPKEGFVASKEDVGSLIDEKLALYGLNDQERKDFLEFWVPKLSKAPYYFITFVSREDIDRTAPLTITPTPDSVIRVLMDYKPLQAPINVQPLQIPTTIREGFTVVEWGGVLRD
ncbi:MAG: hypothetical protein JWN64_779 [Parcubacteria group bacterium]|nr:hypothetical protein [Parcubacteria group bacterium]